MLLGSPDLHQLWVAEIQGEVAGWLHAFWRPLLESPAAVEIGGLAISLRWRRHGAGRALVHVAERWARTKGATTVTLRAAIHREEAPDFYQRQGYALSQPPSANSWTPGLSGRPVHSAVTTASSAAGKVGPRPGNWLP
jgi:GNAT superfamily N-acetyltransferase